MPFLERVIESRSSYIDGRFILPHRNVDLGDKAKEEKENSIEKEENKEGQEGEQKLNDDGKCQEQAKQEEIMENLSVEERALDLHTSSFYGAIAQLGYFSKYSNQILSNLFEESKSCCEKIEKISQRVENLKEEVNSDSPYLSPKFLQFLKSSSYIPEHPVTVSGFLLADSELECVTDYCDNYIIPDPAFYKIDQVFEELGQDLPEKAQNKFSNPAFFFNEWKKTERLCEINCLVHAPIMFLLCFNNSVLSFSSASILGL